MNIEEIKMDHFESFDELIRTCKMWVRDDDIDTYYRFFEFNCMKTLVTAYEKEKEEREKIGKLYYEANENCIKYEKMIKKEKEKNKELFNQLNYIHECFCKFNWKESSGEQVYIQLKELYKSIFGGIKQCQMKKRKNMKN